MLNYLWGGMMAVGVLWAAAFGRLNEVTEALLSSAADGVSLCITMLGLVSFWSGLLEMGEKAGVIRALTGRLEPVIRFLFPELPKGHEAGEQIAVNFIANFLGLGWAATPAGLRAMNALDRLEEERRMGIAPGPVSPRGKAGNEMCTFLVINISSLQLIPVNMIAFRSQYGSAAPGRIVGPSIAATAASTLVAVLFCRLMNRRAS